MRNDLKKISNLHSLDREIWKLKQKARNIEKQLDDNFDYLQHNYSSVLKNSIFKSHSTGENGGGFLMQSFVKNSQLQEALDRVIDHFAGKLAQWIDNLMNRVSNTEKR